MSQVVDDVSTFARGSSIMSNKKKYQPTHQTFGTKFAPKIQEAIFQKTFARGQEKLPPQIKYQPITVNVQERFNQKSPGKFVSV